GLGPRAVAHAARGDRDERVAGDGDDLHPVPLGGDVDDHRRVRALPGLRRRAVLVVDVTGPRVRAEDDVVGRLSGRGVQRRGLLLAGLRGPGTEEVVDVVTVDVRLDVVVRDRGGARPEEDGGQRGEAGAARPAGGATVGGGVARGTD